MEISGNPLVGRVVFRFVPMGVHLRFDTGQGLIRLDHRGFVEDVPCCNVTDARLLDAGNALEANLPAVFDCVGEFMLVLAVVLAETPPSGHRLVLCKNSDERRDGKWIIEHDLARALAGLMCHRVCVGCVRWA